MLSAMPPQDSAHSSPGASYWYNNNTMDGLSPGSANPPPLRRGSEAVIHSGALRGDQDSSSWDNPHRQLSIDTSHAVLHGQAAAAAAAAAAAHKAPLAPKQGLPGGLGNPRNVHQSPISGTYALRTPRGKITSIACENCRKRKSKCDGIRPKCNTCHTKNVTCVYDVAEDGKTTTQLRATVKRLTKELDNFKMVVTHVALASNREAAVRWAEELRQFGFNHYSAEELIKALEENGEHPRPRPPGEDTQVTPDREHFSQTSQSVASSSYGESSRDESREQSQQAIRFQMPESGNDDTTGPPQQPYNLNESTESDRFRFDSTFYRTTKKELVSNGWDAGQVFGRTEIDVDSLLLGFMDPQNSQPVASWAAKTVNKMLPQASMPLRLASTYLLTKMMRWLIWPSIENMNAMPRWLVPLSGQGASSYDLLVDLIPWPQLRRYIYQHAAEFSSGSFLGLIGISWPYAEDACHYWDIESGCTRLTPLFESHVSDLNSWTLATKAYEIHPQLEALMSMP